MRPISVRRRRMLRGMVGAGALAATPSGALAAIAGESAASEGRRPLHALPRYALVIGNSRYPNAPLRNPANDAGAIAALLKGLGFEVTQALDIGRDEMLKTIDTYSSAVGRDGAVGLFYFAGHGLQLAWRNYLVPVDAVIDTPDDVRDRTVNLNTLLQGLTRAKNPMNLIILDACRDNPFGSRLAGAQKGLSQFDAPPGSLLAYATAPGNVASDGDGEHGVYTDNLLRELKVPETKIEDVFKRVRLRVRRRTRGQQIPWESTSLEDDFYFVPPRAVMLADEEAVRKRREEQAERAQRRRTASAKPDLAVIEPQFEEELAFWEKVRASRDPEALEAYLLRYPSGRFTELAQLRLDRILAARGEKPVQIVSSTDNPFSKGFAAADTRYRVGDTYTYRVTDLYTGLEIRTFTHAIEKITEGSVVFDDGMTMDFLGNRTRTVDGRTFGPSQFLPVEFAVGRRWTTRYKFTHPRFGPGQVQMDMHIVAREPITVRAGTFDCFRLEGTGWSGGSWGVTQLDRKIWLAPDRVRRWVVSEDLRRAGGMRVVASEREELMSYRQG